MKKILLPSWLPATLQAPATCVERWRRRKNPVMSMTVGRMRIAGGTDVDHASPSR
ncbi:MAG: hypothetical protein U1C74_14825 [Phenylobacterium sp.]|jgi:hypothetical protein|uniref:Uncharacterized protein n=1 Tax=Brevundimonas mediterranea TaxID=74329 RepID=A0AB37E8X4_9CAUL|nr:MULTISPECIES: hypothetical protein [Brevundimonas]MBU2401945.1 hypothetical protein [Alphaproteobacteria bacterium]MDZ4372681.1 hypothetical protein [Phenylobacterium sp.]MBU4196230.1 hypothetical protein [Alphaproteobacteria bacterium]MCG2662683.1 hypothetical protein [Brevundimonas sp.]QIH73388.1 hypothetical protein GYM46_10770 [Brevundimonas mediterranea]